MGKKATPEPPVHKVPQAHKASKGRKAQQVPPEWLVPRDLQGRSAPPGLPAQQELRALEACLVLKGRRVPKVQPERLDRKVLPERRGLKDHRVLRDQQVLQVRLARSHRMKR